MTSYFPYDPAPRIVPMEISFTQFRIYRECPYKYKLKFLDRAPIPLNPSSSLGSSLHRALERFHRGGGGEREDLMRAYEDGFLAMGYPDARTREEWREKGRKILERYWRGEQERRSEVLGAEREFLWPLGRHEARGMVDRVDRRPDGSIEVIDYKTRLEGEAPEDPAKSLQLRFYALGVKESLAWEPAWLTIHYLAEGRRVSAAYDPAGEEELKGWILEAADAIEAGRFPPETSFCPRCDYRRECPHSAAR